MNRAQVDEAIAKCRQCRHDALDCPECVRLMDDRIEAFEREREAAT